VQFHRDSFKPPWELQNREQTGVEENCADGASPNIVRITKSSMEEWTLHIARMVDMTNG
jgi:hypothetical protein